MLAMIQFNVIDIKETQACYSDIGCILDGIGNFFGAVDLALHQSGAFGRRSLQSPGMSLCIKLFIETNQCFVNYDNYINFFIYVNQLI